jgi:hypothetical protein
MTSTYTEDNFLVIARNLPCASNVDSIRTYKEMFNASPYLCECIWERLVNEKYKKIEEGPIHFLWCLLFLNVYATTYALSSMAGTTTKTFMLHVKEWISILSRLNVVILIYQI